MTARAAVPLLLAAIVVSGLVTSRQISAVFDEVAHIGAGYAYVMVGDYRFNVEHPPLVKLLAGLAVAPMPVRDVLGSKAFGGGDQWGLGAALLAHPGVARWAALDRARLPAILITTMGAAVLVALVRRIHGPKPALLALVIYLGCPNVRGHGAVVHTDVPMMTFGLLAVFLALLARHEWTAARVSALSVVMALGLLTKFNAILLLAIVGIVLLWPIAGRVRLRQCATLLAITTLMTILVGLLLYRGLRFFDLYPRGFWLAYTRAPNLPDYPFYFMGRFDSRGFWGYFVTALVLKTPLPLLVLYIWGLASLLWRRPARDEILAVLWPAAAWLLLTELQAANIGLRYLLPAFPFFFAIAARVVCQSGRLASLAAWLLAAAHALTGIAAADPIGYTNALVRPGITIAYLDDSNVDWGQGLRALRRYEEERSRSKGPGGVNVIYFGGLRAAPFLADLGAREPAPAEVFDARHGMAPGRYAVSQHLLVRQSELRFRLAASCGVENVVGPSLVVYCCPPCREGAPEDEALRLPLPEPPPRRIN